MLRQHCENEGRDYDEITKTVYQVLDIGEHGEKTNALIDELGRLHGLGFDVALGGLPGMPRRDLIEKLGTDVIPAVAAW